MFKMEFTYRFEAAHRFTKSCKESCATPHGHTWYGTLELSGSDKLNQADMLAEFALAKKGWKETIDKTFDHSFLANSEDPLLPHLKQILPEVRLVLFPGDPTTELIAALLHRKAQKIIASIGLQDLLCVEAVTIQETPSNTVVYKDKVGFLPADGIINGYTGWWNDERPEARECFKPRLE
jgi:6-pyruvoyltetrahydropterin/6-carboxytetrahydropterin synthase